MVLTGHSITAYKHDGYMEFLFIDAARKIKKLKQYFKHLSYLLAFHCAQAVFDRYVRFPHLRIQTSAQKEFAVRPFIVERSVFDNEDFVLIEIGRAHV